MQPIKPRYFVESAEMKKNVTKRKYGYTWWIRPNVKTVGPLYNLDGNLFFFSFYGLTYAISSNLFDEKKNDAFAKCV